MKNLYKLPELGIPRKTRQSSKRVNSYTMHGYILTIGVSGVTYTRWGSSSCPNSTEAQLVYAGRAIGTKHNTQGGGAEKLCLPNDPDYLPGTTGHRQSGISHIHGAEYEFFVNTPNRNVDNQVAACAICHVPTRATVIMVPGKTLCPSSWTREYYGYLTTERETYYRSIFTCIDVNAEGVAGAGINTEGAHFYYAGTTCTGIACPPYEDNRILSCAVCTK